MAMDEALAEGRERPGRVIGIGLALLVVVAAVATLLSRSAEPLDGAALVAQDFDVGELPFDFEIVEGRKLALGERVVVLADPTGWRSLELPLEPDVPATEGPEASDASEGSAPSDAAADAPAAGDGPRGGTDGGGRPGEPGWKPSPWATLELGDEGTAPREAALVWYPLGQADEVLRRQFGNVEFRDVAMLDWDGGSTPVDSGYLDWSGYRAGYVLVRTFERRGGKPTFRDRARVNVSIGGSCRVLYVGWSRGERGSRASVEELLAALVPRSVEG